ncbi:MAG: TIGR01212 family radical SAM protein [PVC group bacterium]|nr:TIGR01212 family radical SAM protein [PVC group bacterium]
MQKYYYSFKDYLAQQFNTRVHRISLNAGFSCPNRDGTLSSQGCVFCNEKGFSHFAETNFALEEQIGKSMDIFRYRFKANKFIAYFQNGSNTYADAKDLKKKYDVIKTFPDIVGLMISTRPDCIDKEKLDLIQSYTDKYDVWIEYGIQSIHDRTLDFINRKHSAQQFIEAVEQTAKRNIKISAHVILGLPGESKSDMLKTADVLAKLPITGVKLHVMHILRDTKLHVLYEQGGMKLLESQEYIDIVCDWLERISSDCVIMRLGAIAGRDVLIAPKWINLKQNMLQNIELEFKRRGTMQGSKYKGKG